MPTIIFDGKQLYSLMSATCFQVNRINTSFTLLPAGKPYQMTVQFIQTNNILIHNSV